MTTTVEAWTMPGAGAFTKKDFAVGFGHVQIELANSEYTTGVVSVDRSTKNRLIDSTNNESSLLRVFKDGHNCQSFFAREVRYPYGYTGPIQVVGPSIHSELDYGIVLPQNYPNSNDADFEYAAIDVLENGDAEGENVWIGDDFEEGPPAGDAWTAISGTDWTEPTAFGVTSAFAYGGTYSFRINPTGGKSGAERTVACRPSTVVTITARLGTPEPDDVGAQIGIGATVDEGGGHYGFNQYWIEGRVVAEYKNLPQGTGVTTDTDLSQITELKFITGPQQTSFRFGFFNLGALNVDDIVIDNISISGVGVGTEPWFTWQGVTLERQNSVVDTGDFAFAFQVTDYSITEYIQGILQLVRSGGNVGRRFTFKGRARQNSGSDRDIIVLLKRGSGTWYGGSQLFTLPSGSWVDFEVSYPEIDEDRFYVEVRDADTAFPGGSNGPPIYLDNMEGYWGLGTQTAGFILQQHIDLIKSRGRLTWLKTDSFDGTNDSNSVSWAQDEEMTVYHGMTLYQLLDAFKEKGYEWDVVWNEGAGQYELLFFYPYTMGGDLTGTVKVHAVNSEGSEIVEADPGPNTFYAEGEDGVYAEGANAALQNGYGEREAWIDYRNSLTPSDLGRRIIKSIVSAEDNKFSLHSVVGNWFTPGLTALPGSLVEVEMSGEVPTRDLRIARMVLTSESGENETTVINFGGSDFKPIFDPVPVFFKGDKE